MNIDLIQVTAETVAETVAESEAANVLQNMIANTDPTRFLDTLKYMGVGMLGIFIVMGILIVGTGLLNRILSRKNEDSE